MQQVINGLKRSASVKALVIGLLILILLIPVSMIKSVVRDRIHVHNDARADIMRAWGGEQMLTGPVLVLPYRIAHINSYGNQTIERAFLYVLPNDLQVTVDVNPEIRYRGMHKVPIYSADMNLRGAFAKPDFSSITPAETDVDWDKVFIAMSVSDPRAIAHAPLVDIGDSMSRFRSGGTRFLARTTTPPLVANVESDFADFRQGSALSFAMDMRLNGADSLRIAPLGDTTRVDVTSTWPSPSFVGGYLPETRAVTEEGFTAAWQVSGLGREVPTQWTAASGAPKDAALTTFGVTFYQPIGLYQLSLRAAKYAVLFIGMSFVAYFLFEMMVGLRLHPLQYLLIGFANAVFYLLLLSLAEHIGFAWSYFVSAFASIALIAGYSASVLVRRSRGLLMAAVLAGLYGFLFMTLQAETYALLAGALGLWATLAIVMYLTRRIDWYGDSFMSKDV